MGFHPLCLRSLVNDDVYVQKRFLNLLEWIAKEQKINDLHPDEYVESTPKQRRFFVFRVHAHLCQWGHADAGEDAALYEDFCRRSIDSLLGDTEAGSSEEHLYAQMCLAIKLWDPSIEMHPISHAATHHPRAIEAHVDAGDAHF